MSGPGLTRRPLTVQFPTLGPAVLPAGTKGPGAVRRLSVQYGGVNILLALALLAPSAAWSNSRARASAAAPFSAASPAVMPSVGLGVPALPRLALPELAGPAAAQVAPAAAVLQPAGARADADFAREVGRAIYGAWEGLDWKGSQFRYATDSGVRVVFRPDGAEDDALATAQYQERRVVLDWSAVRADVKRLRALGLNQREAVTAFARGALPLVEHETKHIRLRDEADLDFPPTVEEEVLTHAQEAAAMEAVMRRHRGIETAADGTAMLARSLDVAQTVRRGPEAVAASLYASLPLDYSIFTPEKNLLSALAVAQEAAERPKEFTSRQLWAIARYADFWADPSAAARLRRWLGGRLRQAGFAPAMLNRTRRAASEAR